MEEATREIIEHVHPTVVSEDRRRDVIDYMQRFIQTTLGCEVHSFGSVPLKTYLPEGDIDLTAFGGPWSDEELAKKVFHVLKREKQNLDAEFIIKDVQLIRAEVKLVTCLVENLVVDISFNQLGGICTLCFLEKVDHFIGKDHLFKRSIILIKAWCYYESHILGAVHGLISTYALETLVLYIFHLFHSSLDGPLAVLYKFLDHFSKFDWDNYCISLSGPVCLSSLPKIVVETPDNDGQDLLLTSEFLNECLEMYSVPSRGFETNPRMFPSKYLNVVDPLKENNNLGRSVNKANFYRVRAAFTYGARKLGQILLQPEEDQSFELRKFFSSMLRRHGSGQRPNVLGAVPSVRYNKDNAISPAPAANHVQEGQRVYESESSISSGAAGNDLTGSVSEERLSGNAKDFATERIQKLEISDDAVKSMCVGDDKESVSPLSGKHHSLHGIENGEVSSGSGVEKLQENTSLTGSIRIQEKTPNFLSDLTGDYDTQLNSLRFGRWWFDYVQNGPLLCQLPINSSWEVFPHALPFSWNANGAHVFLMNPQMIPNGNLGMEELPKPRGTGTYFPNANDYSDKPVSTRRNSRRNNGRNRAHLPSEMNFLDGNKRERHHHLHHYLNQANGSCDRSQAGIHGSFSGTNGLINHPYEKAPQFRQSYHLTDDQEFPPL